MNIKDNIMLNRGTYYLSLLGLFFLSSQLLLSGCANKSERSLSEDIEHPIFSYSVRSINTGGDAELVVKTVRAIIVRPSSGEVLFNDLMKWKNGGSTTTAPIDGEPSLPVKWMYEPGAYDMYFVANEATLSTDNRSKLQGLYNVVDLSEIAPVAYTSAEMNSIDIDSKPLLSTAVKKGVVIATGTEQNPQVVGGINLVRNLSKVTVSIYRKKDPKSASDVKHALIKGLQLVDLASNYHLFFQPKSYDNYTSMISSAVFGNSILDQNYIDAIDSEDHQIFKSKEYYISEHLFDKNDVTHQPARLKVTYLPSADEAQEEIYFNLDAGVEYQDFITSYKSKVLSYIAQDQVDLSTLGEHSIFRGVHYKVHIDILDAKAKPVIDIEVAPWDLIEQEVQHKEYIFSTSKEQVLFEYPKGAVNRLKILSNIDDNRQLTWTMDEETQKWIEITTPSTTSYTFNGNKDGYVFDFKAKSENFSAEPRKGVITFTAAGYEHPVKVQLIQRPRQLMVTRHYISFIGDGGTSDIDVDNFGFEWEPTIVENISTMAHNSDWIKVSKKEESGEAAKLHIEVASTMDTNMIRYAVIKLFDGSHHASYIRVEQANYKPLNITSPQMTILDRNLGAMRSARDQNTWSPDAAISNRERVMLNGFYYQVGRVPDGSHILGMFLREGANLTDIPDDKISQSPISLELRPNGYPIKWNDIAYGHLTGKDVQDEQYGKFIAHDDKWFTSSGSVPEPRWTNPSGGKNVGVDPCPEGYRIPSYEQMNMLLNSIKTRFVVPSCGFWIDANENGKPVQAYFPIAAYRDGGGKLDVSNRWLYEQDSLEPDKEIVTYYATSTIEDGKMKAVKVSVKPSANTVTYTPELVPFSFGVVVRCIKE